VRVIFVLFLVIASGVEGAGGARGTFSAATVRPDPSTDARDDMTDYDRELGRIDGELASASGVRRVYLLYLRASLTHDVRDFRAVELALEDVSLPQVSAHLAYKLHRFGEAKTCACDPALAADIALQEGRLEDARRAYEALPRTWDNLARLANYHAKSGDIAAADRLYAEAGEELTAKEMRDFAWIELQRGILDLEAGKPKKALEHYGRASQAWSGWWLIDEHRAEALQLLGRTEEAVALYRRILTKSRKPQIVSALAAIVKSDELFAEAEARFAEERKLYPEAASGHMDEHRRRRNGAAGAPPRR
jgi:tetratricopeptide (TPR) repeat protein